MQIGEFDRKIILERLVTTLNEFNEPTTDWTEIGKRSASKEDVSDGEKVRAAQVGASVSARFRVRYDSVTSKLTAADRLTCEGVQYQISGTKEGDGRRREIEITAARPNDNLVPEPTP